MHISKNGLDIIKKYEGFYSKAYYCPGGVLTIGYGTTNADSKVLGYTINTNSTITKEKALEFLKKSIANKYEPNVNKYMFKYSFNQNQYDALVSFCYNIGSIDQLVSGGKKSIKNIGEDMLLYDHANGKKLKGLTKRRQEESKLFCTPVASSCINSTNNTGKSTTKYSVTSDGLNVRSGPSTEYKVINQLTKGKTVNIAECKGSWGRLANTNNWINLKYTKKCNAVVNAVNKGIAYKVTSTGLYVRNGVGVSYKIVNSLGKGSIVYIDKTKSGWGRLTNTNNWINLKYAKKC